MLICESVANFVSMTRVFAIGDVHGCSRTFRKMVLEEIKLRKGDVLYCLGDYVDRGKDSKGVVDFIMQLRLKGYSVIALRGNHEQLMMDSVQSEARFNHWTDNGGYETLESFGVDSYRDVPLLYKGFFRGTELYSINNRYIFVHAGLNFNSPDPLEDKESMLWIRDWKVDKDVLGDGIIVHGHTPIALGVILAQAGGNVYNLDGGCVYKQREGLGNLVGLNVTESKFIVVRNID